MKTIFSTLILALSTLNSFSMELAPVVKGPKEIANFKSLTNENLEWQKLDEQLKKVKELGVTTISTEVWWSVVEKEDNQFDWSYYDKLMSVISANGLKWSPEIAFHSCFKNIQDICNIPLPNWLWKKYESQDIKYKDEFGNESIEYISVWSTDLVIKDYQDFLKSFKEHYSTSSKHIADLNISLGPDGELRYPSFNREGILDHGLNQAYSALAQKSFQDYSKSKYKTIENINSIWNSNYSDFSEVLPPKSEFLKSTQVMESNYLIDFYSWYNQSLLDHAELLLSTGIRVFNSENSTFMDKEISAKLPNIHWETEHDRLAELNAGVVLINEDLKDEILAKSYTGIFKSLTKVKEITKFKKLVLSYDGLEKSNIEETDKVTSRAKDLVFSLSLLASEKGIEIKGSNSNASNLGSNIVWDNMWSAIQEGSYSGLTINSLDKLTDNMLALDFLSWIIENVKN